MSIYMTVYKCICMHEYMYACMQYYACMYCMRIYECACIYVYMHVCIYVCMCAYMYVHCIYIIFKLGFERNGGNSPSWEGELSGGIVRGGKLSGEGNCPGVKCPGPLLNRIGQFQPWKFRKERTLKSALD